MFTLKMLYTKIVLYFFFGMLRLLQHICSLSVFFIPSMPGLWILTAGQGTNVYFRWGYRIATLLLKLAHSCCFSNWCDGQIHRDHLLSTHKHTLPKGPTGGPILSSLQVSCDWHTQPQHATTHRCACAHTLKKVSLMQSWHCDIVHDIIGSSNGWNSLSDTKQFVIKITF